MALVDEVVDDSGRSDLVRGSVWLGVAEAVDGLTHARVFDAWLNGTGELARAGLFAASRRFERDHCVAEVDFASILAADAPEQLDIPAVYQIPFEAQLRGPEAISLKLWLDSDDPRRGRILAGDTDIFIGPDGAEMLDYLLTAELAFVLWGLGANESDVVADEIVRELQLGGVDQAKPFVLMRAAAFLAHNLAECSTILFDAVIALDQSDERVHKMLGQHFRRKVNGALSVAQMAHIERIKYTVDEMEEVELILALDRIEDQVRDLDRVGPLQRQETVDYLSMIAADSLVSPTARAVAVQAVASTGAWDSLRSCAAQVMATGSDIDLQAITITALYRQARVDTSRAPSAIALLQGFRAANALPELHASIDEYVRLLGAS